MGSLKNTVELTFEDKIWKAADKLRGSLDAAEYKSVVLGLIFLKYISDRFESRYQELVEEGEGFEEDRDEYAYKNIFFVPQDSRWSVIAQAAHTPEIGKVIDNAMRHIENENDTLKGVLPKNFARQELDKRRLGDVVDLFTNIKLSEDEGTKDVLGRTYEYCLSKFAALEGKNAGEFYTPTCIVKTLVEIIQPLNGRVYDPCCGSGGMFVQSAKFIDEHAGNLNNISIYGQESNPTTWKMAVMNLAIRGLSADLGPHNDDTFFNDLHKNERFDYVLANPPFNLKDWGGDKLKEDPRWDYGIPSEGNANFAWLQHMIHHLSARGRIGLVLANGALSSQTGTDGDIRKAIIEDDLVEGIISMPSQLFFSTGIPVSLWIIDRDKKQKGKTLFIDARNMGTMINRKLRDFTDEDITKVSHAFDAFRKGELEEEKGFSAIASIEDIVEQDCILTPGRYVGIEEQEEDSELFEEKMDRLTSELSDLFEESHVLEGRIKSALAGIGFKL